jgi:hypothetical protein
MRNVILKHGKKVDNFILQNIFKKGLVCAFLFVVFVSINIGVALEWSKKDKDDDSETINEVKWMLYELEKSQAYDIQALIENKWNLRASDIAIIISKFIPSLVYGYSGIIKDLHLGHSVDHRIERVMKNMIQDEMIKDK